MNLKKNWYELETEEQWKNILEETKYFKDELNMSIKKLILRYLGIQATTNEENKCADLLESEIWKMYYKVMIDIQNAIAKGNYTHLNDSILEVEKVEVNKSLYQFLMNISAYKSELDGVDRTGIQKEYQEKIKSIENKDWKKIEKDEVKLKKDWSIDDAPSNIIDWEKEDYFDYVSQEELGE